MSYKFVRPQDPTRELKIWEAARATAAAPPYFKPFQTETTDIYTDGAIHHNCPATVADYERRLLWEEVSDWPLDLMLSLGTGLGTPGTPSGSSPVSIRSKSNNWSRRSGNGLTLMWWAANAIVEDQLNCEEIWKRHCAQATPPGTTHSIEEVRRNLRVNVSFPGPRPNLDDAKGLENMERYVENFIREDPDIGADIHEAAHRLIASCFYYEKSTSGILDRATGVYKCEGKTNFPMSVRFFLMLRKEL